MNCIICDKKKDKCLCEKRYTKEYIQAFKDGYRKAQKAEWY